MQKLKKLSVCIVLLLLVSIASSIITSKLLTDELTYKHNIATDKIYVDIASAFATKKEKKLKESILLIIKSSIIGMNQKNLNRYKGLCKLIEIPSFKKELLKRKGLEEYDNTFIINMKKLATLCRSKGAHSKNKCN